LTEIVLLVALAPLAWFPTPGRFAALLAIPAWWLWRWARQRPGRAARAIIPRTPLDGAITLLVFMVLVSVYATNDLAASLPKIAGVVYGVGLYYGVARVSRAPGAATWASLLAVALAGLALAALGLLGTRWPVKFAGAELLKAFLPARFQGLPGAETGFDPNEVAGTLVWVLPPALALTAAAARHAGALRRAVGSAGAVGLVLLLGGSACLSLLVLALSQSRGAALGLGLVVLLMSAAALWRRRRLVVASATAGMIVCVLAVAAVGPREVLRLAAGLDSAGEQVASLDTVEGRLETWNRAIFGIQDFPVTGMGMNTFRLLVHLLYPMYIVAPDVDIGHAHNLWLQAALDLGLPGLCAYAAMWLGAGGMLVRVWRTGHRIRMDARSLSFARPLALGLAGGLAAHFVFGLADAVAIGAKPGMLWWSMLGLIAGLYEQTRSAMHSG
jgi:putative inorganic carbon (HCO3(-)) transporter